MCLWKDYRSIGENIMVQKASRLPTKTDLMLAHELKIKELLGTMRKRVTIQQSGLFGGTPMAGATNSAASGQGGTGDFLRTKGDTMIGPIAFFPVDVARDTTFNFINISPNAANPPDYSSYVFMSISGDLQFIDGTAWAGQWLILQGVNQFIFTVKSAKIRFISNIVGDGATQIITVTTAVDHGFSVSEVIQIDGTTNFNARASIISTPTATTFTYDLGSVGSATAETTGSAKNGNVLSGSGNDVILDGTVDDFNAPIITLVFDISVAGGVWRVIGVPKGQPIPPGTAENDHLEWDNTANVWLAQQFFEMGSAGPHASLGDIRFKNNSINLAWRNALNTGEIELKASVGNFIDITNNQNEPVGITLRTQNAIEPDTAISMSVGSGPILSTTALIDTNVALMQIGLGGASRLFFDVTVNTDMELRSPSASAIFALRSEHPTDPDNSMTFAVASGAGTDALFDISGAVLKIGAGGTTRLTLDVSAITSLVLRSPSTVSTFAVLSEHPSDPDNILALSVTSGALTDALIEASGLLLRFGVGGSLPLDISPAEITLASATALRLKATDDVVLSVSSVNPFNVFAKRGVNLTTQTTGFPMILSLTGDLGGDESVPAQIIFSGDDSVGTKTEYAIIKSRIKDPTTPNERGALEFEVNFGGGLVKMLEVSGDGTDFGIRVFERLRMEGLNQIVINDSFLEFTDSIASPGQTGIVRRLFTDSGNSDHLSVVTDTGIIDLEVAAAAGGAGLTFASVVKTVNDVVNNSVVQVADSQLKFEAEAGSTYGFTVVIIFTADFPADMDIGWTGPSAFSMSWGFDDDRASKNETEVEELFGQGLTNQKIVRFSGRIITPNAGTVNMTFAQRTAQASNAVVRIGSSLRVYEAGATPSAGGGAWTVIETHEAAIAESSFTFNFSTIDFDDDSTLLLMIDVAPTIILDLLVGINGLTTTTYFIDGRRIKTGSETIIDLNSQTAWRVASTNLLGANSNSAVIWMYFSAVKSGNIPRVFMQSTATSLNGGSNEVLTGMNTTGSLSSLTSIEVKTSTSTWIIGSRMTLYRLSRT